MTSPLPSLPSSRLSRRSMLALGGGTALSAVLAACGGNTGREATPTSDAAAGTSGGGAKPSLAQWYHQYGEEGTQEAVEGYAAGYPGADVKVSWKPGDYDQSTAASLLTDAGPDVFEYGNGPTIDMIKGGQVVDLTDVFGDTLSDFTPSLIERMTYDGKIWGIPQVVDMQILVYRKSILDKAGIAAPESIDDLVAAAKELTTGDQFGLFLGNDGGAGLMGGSMLWAAGLDYLDGDQVGFDDPRAAEALAVLRTLWQDKSVLLGAPKDWFDAAAFTSGQAAMQWTGLWTFPSIQDALGDDFGAIPWPAMTGGAPSVPVGSYGSCVSAKSADVDAATAFAKWLWVDQTAHQLDFATSYGFHIPARLSLVPQAEVLAKGPARDAADAAAKYGHAQTPMLWTPKSATAWGDLMSRVVKDGSDPQQELDKLKPIVEAELERVTA
ncbi:MAG: sugar ABC transporter substrate-binding protein [Ornithinimicrobium sp.]|uniref:ABC transporter substrate-binding protein n=1 Tax=Ornithinimicrobium sp. TaxID=1977084 RepID=UPI0026DEC6EE|nr:sugar ABC transporter substrate-binding protein [Ornithinimicrobium sp.]MDO5740233.1 sugar ABC transporter substrate-binding protein [Ornithinimicrobium sp.]